MWSRVHVMHGMIEKTTQEWQSTRKVYLEDKLYKENPPLLVGSN
jgi:hypothetical protein